MHDINANTTVKELLDEHLEAFETLASWGMCSNCKYDPPQVPLEHFANKHCGGNVENLLKQINTAIHEGKPEQA